MRVELLREAGYEEALLGLSLSYNTEPSERVARNLAHKQGGHNKFLESIHVWIDVTAPRYFWQQFDTYRIGVTKQSESTMHTLMRTPLTSDSFCGWINPSWLNQLQIWQKEGNFTDLKAHLPEAFLQRRIVCTNYKALQAIYMQRKNHKLPEWGFFFNTLLPQLDHPGFIKEDYESETSLSTQGVPC